MKTLIEVERSTWGKVKEYATIRGISLSLAVHQLLIRGLSDMKEMKVSESQSNNPIYKQIL